MFATLPMTLPDIFEYHDFRAFLKDAYAARKAESPSFSHRYIAMKAGFGSSGSFARILDGSRNLSMDAVPGLCRVFGFNRAERSYFEHLVLHNQAETEAERHFFLEKLAEVRKSHVVEMQGSQLALFEDWRHIAIRELLDMKPAIRDTSALAARLDPPATTEQAERSLDLLESLGLVRRDEDGFWHKADPVLTTPDGISRPIRAFQTQTMDLAKDALERHPPEDREIATLTLSISSPMMERVKERIRQLRREILEMARADDAPDRVFQVNFQVFPLSRRAEESS